MLALAQAGPTGDPARRRLAADPVWLGPAHLPLEVLRSIWRYEQSGLLDRTAGDALAAEVLDAEVRFGEPDGRLLAWVWRHRDNVSPYDAPYVALALRHAVPLVTGDARLARAARALGADAVVV